MSDMPLVSIVTPSYNQGQFIEETILSVKNQDYPNIEHIIMDGGSTDSSLDVIRRYDGTYNMRWTSESDEGMYHAINKGLCLCRGDVLAYLNTDDRYFPWTVAVAVQALVERQDVDFIFGDMLNVSEGTNSASLHFYPPFRLGFIRRTDFLGQPTVFWRRRILDQFVGFDESLKFVADCDYWMRIGAHFRGYKVNEVLAIERNHTGAKRFAQGEKLHRELDQVRSRYIRQRGLGYRAQRIGDRIYGFLWRRYYLLRFLYADFKAPSTSGYENAIPWGHFAASKVARVSRVRALATFLPFAGRPFAQKMVRVNPRLASQKERERVVY